MATSSPPFSRRMAQLARKKKSRIIVALDPAPVKRNLKQFAIRTIDAVAGDCCAVKMNFHLLLPLSSREIAEVTKRAHSRQLLCIADIKLNDIGDTNEVALEHLARMGFDAVIANPFMGANTLASLAKRARALGMGVIALVYMSHPDAGEGYGLQTHGDMMYRIFLDRAVKARVDGIVVGATQTDILSEISEKKKELKVSSLAVYSPGVGAQGGDARQAVESGSDYLIIGRSIVQTKDQAMAARWFRLLAASPSP